MAYIPEPHQWHIETWTLAGLDAEVIQKKLLEKFKAPYPLMAITDVIERFKVNNPQEKVPADNDVYEEITPCINSEKQAPAMVPMNKGNASRCVKRKHRTLSIKDKVELLKKLDSGVSVRSLCELYSIGSSTVYDIKKQKEKLLSFFANSDSKEQMCKRKTMKDGKSSELDQVMMKWLRLCVSEGVELSGDLVKKQAKAFHEELGLDYECDYSEGWLQRFKDRHGLKFRAVCGEKRSADKEAAAKFIEEFAKLVSDEKLSPEQVYNAADTALYWKCTPRRTLATEDAESPTGYKALKDRVTVLGCSNAAGTHRCKLLVIGKSLRPRAFKGMTQFPVIYHANKKGWMKTDITLDWFENYFVPEARAHCDSVGLDHNCKIMLILDNCSTHPKAERLVKNNVFSIDLPHNCTSLIQPQDNGILRSFKFKYRTYFMRHLLSVVNSGRPVCEFLKEFNVRDMVYCVANAWKSVEATTLKNGWCKLWPGLMFETAPGEDIENDFIEKQIIHDLLSFARDLTNPVAKDLALRMDEDNVGEWMNVDEDVATVHHYIDSEIVHMVVSPQQEASGGESSDENEEDVAERVSIDRLIQLIGELLKGLEQCSFISEQEIMNIYMLQDKLIKERPKYMKQIILRDVLKNIAKRHSTEESPLENPVPSTSALPDVLPPSSSVPDISVTFQDEEDCNPDSSSPQDM